MFAIRMAWLSAAGLAVLVGLATGEPGRPAATGQDTKGVSRAAASSAAR
jgi:hypothetical protein